MRRLLVVLTALVLLAGCATTPPGALGVRDRLAEVQSRLYAYVGAERMRLNAQAKPLRLDPELAAAAQAHSDAMAMRQAFDSDGENDNVAIQRLVANPKFQGYVGENSAMQYFTPELGIDPDAVARTFMTIWLNSPPHQRNLTFPNFDRTGIGIAVSGNQIYAALLFATDLGLPEPP